MKKIIVKENQKGLLFKNGKFVKLLEAGKYHLFGDSHAELLSAEGQLTSDTCTLETLLKAPEIARQVSVVEVGDQQMALHFVDGKFVHEMCIRDRGNKERLVYFDARTKIHLQNYVMARLDDNPALFVTLRAPYTRLQIGGVEKRLRDLGRKLHIPRVHPHKFRRTLATTAIDKGMPIEQVQQLLGHQKIDTTMHLSLIHI